MPFPLIPAALSVIGGLAPSIISSIAGAKSEDEARIALQPKMDAMRAQLIGRGVPSSQVDEQVSEAFKGIIQDEMQKGALPGWAEMLLGLAGGGAGYMAGKALTKGGAVLAKGATTAAAKQADEGAAAITKTADPLAKHPIKPDPMKPDPLKRPELPPEPEIMPQTMAREVPAEGPLEELMTPFAARQKPRRVVYEPFTDEPPLPDDIMPAVIDAPIAAPLRAPFAPAVRRRRE